ncbi:dTDP-4-dehydrorhamnose reductase [Erythrobacter sp. SD-21]|uniref:dTDP-4-dehydrorhamnose reductase n=1 Tax=Erythrobacter sp. SD-21 TaxID=161528 RepID=UPI000153F29E|nr:dTDP-4-dehydrorhamnose reductase [Erythrobacter sp. SD-21]EDL49311.1 dTDP-4-dehydrorhamnose reductase [Erythrobacter sp. SD-21]
MRVLLTGATGQVGKALRHSVPDNIELYPFDRTQLDIANETMVRRIVDRVRPQVILNAAAYTHVDGAEEEPDLAAAVNTQAVELLVKAASAIDAKLVHVSTDFVFDGEAGRPYRTADKTRPKNVYGETKRAGERALRSSDLLVRTAWVYDNSGRNFLTTMLRLFRERDKVSVVCDQIGTPTTASDLSSALWRLIEANVGGTQHFTNSGVASWYDFAVAIAEEARVAGLLDHAVDIVPIPSSAYPTLAKRPHFSVLDCHETYRLIGVPASHWHAALRAALKEIK